MNSCAPQGKVENDAIIQMLHNMIDDQFMDGHWGATEGASPDGNMKMLVDYSRLDWPIPDHRKLIDYTLSFATEEAGFEVGVAILSIRCSAWWRLTTIPRRLSRRGN